jgi:hypothetical protein
MFPIKKVSKQGHVLSLLLLKFLLENAISRVQVKQDGWKLNGTHQLVVCADYFNILSGSVYNIKENAETFSSC